MVMKADLICCKNSKQGSAAGLSRLPCTEVESRTKHCPVSNLPAWVRLHEGSPLKESDLGVIQKVSLHIKIHVQETLKQKTNLLYPSLPYNVMLCWKIQ